MRFGGGSTAPVPCFGMLRATGIADGRTGFSRDASAVGRHGSDANPHRHSHAYSYGHAEFATESSTHRSAARYAHGGAHRYTNAHGSPNSCGNFYARAHAGANPNIYTKAHTGTDVNAGTKAYAETDSYAGALLHADC